MLVQILLIDPPQDPLSLNHLDEKKLFSLRRQWHEFALRGICHADRCEGLETMQLRRKELFDFELALFQTRQSAKGHSVVCQSPTV